MTRDPEIVWLYEQRTFAVLVTMGAYFSRVKYTREGIDYEIDVDNDEWEFYERHIHDYEQD
jgi:hypothetical protein